MNKIIDIETKYFHNILEFKSYYNENHSISLISTKYIEFCQINSNRCVFSCRYNLHDKSTSCINYITVAENE